MPAVFCCLASSATRLLRSPDRDSSMPSAGSPIAANRAEHGRDGEVARLAVAATSSQCSGADTRASGVGRTE